MTADIAVCYGALRSGSTLLRLMLDAHPALNCPGESDYFLDHLILDDGPLRYDWDAMRADRIFRASGLERPGSLDGVEALHAMIEQIRRRGAGTPVLMLHRRFQLVPRLLPQARVLRLKRDPRDVARSNIGMGWAGNTYHGIDRWLATEADWEAGAPHLTAPPHEIRYEDLILAPEPTLADACAFLGLPFDSAMLSYSSRTSYAAPDPSLVEQWRRKQTPDEVALVEGRLGERLIRYGYAPSGRPPHVPGTVERCRLWIENKAHVWGHMARRYGLFTVAQRGLARRLGLTRMANAAQARIDAITIRHLK